jgi:transcriptional regulator GlxA family with amidase domain
MAHRITLVGLDECFASNIVGSADLLSTANLVAAQAGQEPPFEWQVLSPHGRSVRASNGLRLPVDGDLDRRPPAKLIIVPATCARSAARPRPGSPAPAAPTRWRGTFGTGSCRLDSLNLTMTMRGRGWT